MRLHGGHIHGCRVDVLCHVSFIQQRWKPKKKGMTNSLGHKKPTQKQNSNQLIAFGLATGSMSPKIGPASGRKGKLWDKWVFGTTSCFKTLTDYGFSYIKSKQNLSRNWGFKIQHAVFTIHYRWSVDGLNLNLGAKCFLTGNIQNHPKPFPTKKKLLIGHFHQSNI